MPVGLARTAGFMGLNNWLKTVLNKLSAVLTRRSGEIGTVGRHHYSLLARFIFQESHCRKKAPAAPKPGAFLPGPSSLKISALWRDALTEPEIWNAGDLVGRARGKRPVARADFDVVAVAEAKLTVDPDPQPDLPRHVNLSGWPNAKDEQKAIALLLCARSVLLLRENSDCI